MWRCGVSWCSQTAKEKSTLFDLPKEETAKAKWLNALKINPAIPEKFFVCSNHFTDDCFESDTSLGLFTKLNPDAVPCLDYIIRDKDLNKMATELLLDECVSEEDPIANNSIICRACLSECSDDNKSLELPEYLRLFQNSTGITLQMSECLPSTLCLYCYGVITNWQQFVKKCKTNNNLLLKRNKNILSTSRKRKNKNGVNGEKRPHLISHRPDCSQGLEGATSASLELMHHLPENMKAVLSDMLFESSSDSSEDEAVLKTLLALKPRNMIYTTPITKYSENDFTDFFRLQRPTVEFLLAEYNKSLNENAHIPQFEMPGEKELIITLRYLSKDQTLFELSKRFDATVTAIRHCIARVTNWLVRISPKYIKWPQSGDERFLNGADFEHLNVIGAMGVIQIPILPEEATENENCISLQGIVDANKKFINIFAMASTSSCSSLSILEQSDIYKLIQKNYREYFDEGQGIIGGAEYPKHPWVITPNTGDIDMKIIDQVLVVGDTFDQLKRRFRRLEGFNIRNQEFILNCIKAACTIHNISIDFKDDTEFKDMEESSSDNQSYERDMFESDDSWDHFDF